MKPYYPAIILLYALSQACAEPSCFPAEYRAALSEMGPNLLEERLVFDDSSGLPRSSMSASGPLFSGQYTLRGSWRYLTSRGFDFMPHSLFYTRHSGKPVLSAGIGYDYDKTGCTTESDSIITGEYYDYQTGQWEEQIHSYNRVIGMSALRRNSVMGNFNVVVPLTDRWNAVGAAELTYGKFSGYRFREEYYKGNDGFDPSFHTVEYTDLRGASELNAVLSLGALRKHTHGLRPRYMLWNVSGRLRRGHCAPSYLPEMPILMDVYGADLQQTERFGGYDSLSRELDLTFSYGDVFPDVVDITRKTPLLLLDHASFSLHRTHAKAAARAVYRETPGPGTLALDNGTRDTLITSFLSEMSTRCFFLKYLFVNIHGDLLYKLGSERPVQREIGPDDRPMPPEPFTPLILGIDFNAGVRCLLGRTALIEVSINVLDADMRGGGGYISSLVFYHLASIHGARSEVRVVVLR